MTSDVYTEELNHWLTLSQWINVNSSVIVYFSMTSDVYTEELNHWLTPSQWIALSTVQWLCNYLWRVMYTLKNWITDWHCLNESHCQQFSDCVIIYDEWCIHWRTESLTDIVLTESLTESHCQQFSDCVIIYDERCIHWRTESLTDTVSMNHTVNSSVIV